MDFQDFDCSQQTTVQTVSALSKLFKSKPFIVSQLLERRPAAQSFTSASFLEQLLV